MHPTHSISIHFILCLIFSSFLFQIHGQNDGKWEWISGDDDVDQEGYIEPPRPSSRMDSISWIYNNTLWLFGGYGLDMSSNKGVLNDLWSFSIESNHWTFVSGNQTIGNKGIYDDKGNESDSSYPGSRQNSISFMDKQNEKLWLFGGFGFDYGSSNVLMNDLWSFNINTKKWAWVSGNYKGGQNGIYNSIGVEDDSSIPGSRKSSISWIYNETLYFFGGYGFDNSSEEDNGYLNDLWSFNINTNNWTWVSGEKIKNQHGIYGVKGEPSRNNIPGSRSDSISFMDHDKKNLWLYGGFGSDNTSIEGHFNDLWKYSIEENNWTWISGDYSVNKVAEYEGPENLINPGSRSESVSFFEKFGGKLFLFGGVTYNDTNSLAEEKNDLWYYSNEVWTWYSGNKTSLTEGIYNDTNNNIYPGSRRGSISWMDEENLTLWLFGGYGFSSTSSGILNDLWSFSINGEPNLGPNLGPNPLPDSSSPFFDHCDSDPCVIYINTSLIVDGSLIITNNTIIFIPPSNTEPLIINLGPSPIEIKGGQIFLNLSNEIDYNNFLNNIKQNSSFEYILIEGEYIGSFDSIELITPSIDSCEKIESKLKDDKDKKIYSIIFSIDKSSCSSKMKWWIILLICIGIIIILVIIFIIISLKSKRFRRVIFPFRRSKSRDKEIQHKGKNEIYETKSKKNPIHE